MYRDALIAHKNEQIYYNPQLNQVRREELAVNDGIWIEDLLHRGAFGTLATAAGEQPFLNTHNYVYDDANHCIYFHRDPAGRTSANLERNPRACYQVVEMGRMYGSSDALDFGTDA